MRDIYFRIENGQIKNKLSVKLAFEGLEDGSYTLDIKPRRIRTKSQNDYLHAIVFPEVLEGLKQAGFWEVRTTEDAKIICKNLFLKASILNEKANKKIDMIKDTSKLSKEEMAEFIEKIILWAKEYLNIHIPEPNSQKSFPYATY